MGSNSILYNLMEDIILKEAAEVTTEIKDLVDRESAIWNGEYVTHGILPQQFHISPAVEEMHTCTHLFDDMFVAHNTLELNSAFIRYNKESSNGFQPIRKASMKQKSIKRCFEFFRRIHESERKKSRNEVNDRVMEESYASTHRTAERNRRIKLSQQFLALRNLLLHNPKKCGKHSILSNAIVELNQQKLRIKELEQHNKSLMNEVMQHTCEVSSCLSYGIVEDLAKLPLMASICEEVVVVVKESDIADERAIMCITLKNIGSNYNYMDAIVALVKCLKEMKVRVGRIHCWDLDSMNQVIEVTIQRQTTEEEWGPFQRNQLQKAVKRALNAT